MDYPTITMTIPRYNWKMEVTEPGVDEYYDLLDAYRTDASSTESRNKIKAFWSKHIKSWDCKGQDGADLTIDAAGVGKLPWTALSAITKSLIQYCTSGGENTPLVSTSGSGSSVTSAPEPVATR